jgi:hypothetical protein
LGVTGCQSTNPSIGVTMPPALAVRSTRLRTIDEISLNINSNIVSLFFKAYYKAIARLSDRDESLSDFKQSILIKGLCIIQGQSVNGQRCHLA